MTSGGRAFITRSTARLRHVALASIWLCASVAHSQGCAQCRDNTAATPPATQRAYRHAIALLAVTGGAIFTGAVVLLRKLG